jgi:hypothetical protein
MKKKNQTTGYMMSILKDPHLSNFHCHHNSPCVVCHGLEEEMIRVGAVIFCKVCVEFSFTSDDPVRKERETYLKWLHKRS